MNFISIAEPSGSGTVVSAAQISRGPMIDALAGLLPMAAHDRLAETLSPAEIDTPACADDGAAAPRALVELALLAWTRGAFR